MPMFSPGPYKGEQRRNPAPRPAAEIKAEVDEMIAHFRRTDAKAKP